MTVRGWLYVFSAVGTLGLFGCSEVGPGLKNHPVDCAMGIPWGDCLPGTPGYNNGGGSFTRAKQRETDRAEIDASMSAAQAECSADMQSVALDPIRSKVELVRPVADAPVPFAIAANDSFPTEPERVAIAQWASLREACVRRNSAAATVAPVSDLDAVYMEQLQGFTRQLEGRVGALIVSLYQAKLTYGEFAQARFEAGKQISDARREFRSAALIADEQRRMQAQMIAQQQVQDNLLAWSAYTQSVTARQPQTVYMGTGGRLQANCFSQRTGSFVRTQCF